MNVKVKKVSFDESVLEIYTKSGIKTLKITKTQYGHSYEDFAKWDITDEQYYALEELVNNIIERMKNNSVLNVSWEC
ncbi:hypothetical protein [Ureibacillus sp. FSL K6-0165]|uniref:hypothetical protein n=1 Tax=Ureibacillus sp. FSL K6-0165 TaxID=2954606 RepID=UPI0030FB69A9